MRRILFVLFLSAVLTGAAGGHPPSAIHVDFDSEKSLLTITVDHDTKAQNEHYINEIMIKVNKKKRILHSITLQENEKSQRASYLLTDIRPGDMILIMAKCNVFGRQEVNYEVKGK